ncbi:MAG: transglycosylase domain-containing protein [Deltaproteobacteria bacterium]|nr:transglycosylase domain-containing protein [Deltaproteobacteria bacterium]
MRRKRTIAFFIAAGLLTIAAGALVWKTFADLRPLPASLNFETSSIRKVQVQDRNGIPLTITYENRWNIHDYVPLHDIPPLLRQAFVSSEDQRFYRHHGVDWRARLMALFQNIKNLRAVRGASTITEQVVRLWRPRPRTLWSRWLEGFEAYRLETLFSKAQILECYLNQVPYAARRRGVLQAARYYFDRDLDTLSPKEVLALTVMVRAPGRLNPHKDPEPLEKPILHLAERMLEEKKLSPTHFDDLAKTPLEKRKPVFAVNATHFVQHLYNTTPSYRMIRSNRLHTTLSAPLQEEIQAILDQRLQDLKVKGVHNGAVLVVDHQRSEILAWVNGGASLEAVRESWIDAVKTPRQPGSALKPFLYAMALEKGWTAATRVADLPLAAPVGHGLHTYHNYSRTHYGMLPLRQALGNSLNTPAVRTIQLVSVERFLDCLKSMGIRNLYQHPDYYGEGLALGNGEITLLELVGAYTVLANRGVYRPLKTVLGETAPTGKEKRVFSAETASLIGNILSDPGARKLEFGSGGLLRFPIQTAVKTGTSSDYRDAWAMGYNDRFTVGIWMGNLDHHTTGGITGASGPALILRSVFAELNRNRQTRPLYLSPRLKRREICLETGLPDNGRCVTVTEWFAPGTEPEAEEPMQSACKRPYVQRPSEGLQLAMDPRIPDDHEAFQFQMANLPENATVCWYVDGKSAATTTGNYLWPLSKGLHRAMAEVWAPDLETPIETASVKFMVK